MEPISDVKWDVVLGGTGLSESLLALSLSRSDKKILHVDRSGYYGGAEAALSLQDAEEWAKHVNDGELPLFAKAKIIAKEGSGGENGQKLGFSRSYSLALAPQMIYCKSDLIQSLVASKVYRQLEFLAVGSWWIYQPAPFDHGREQSSPAQLRRIPNRREDIFEDTSLDMRSKRALIKFLRLIMDAEAQAAVLQESGNTDLQSFLTEQFRIQPQLQTGLHALTLAPWPVDWTPLSFALPRITRHLSSFGIFGTGFGAVIPKWGGLAEIAQVACRALAVGGGVYMLGTGITSRSPADADGSQPKPTLQLQSGDTVHASCVASVATSVPQKTQGTLTRSITIVASELKEVFPSLGEGAPKPAAAVVVFQSSTLNPSMTEDWPVYLIIHASDAGECPAGQSVIYASVGLGDELAPSLLAEAVTHFLGAVSVDSETSILWNLTYRQSGQRSQSPRNASDQPHAESNDSDATSIELPAPSLDLAFDDSVLDSVRAAWSKIIQSRTGFLDFEDREVGAYDSEEEG